MLWKWTTTTTERERSYQIIGPTTDVIFGIIRSEKLSSSVQLNHSWLWNSSGFSLRRGVLRSRISRIFASLRQARLLSGISTVNLTALQTSPVAQKHPRIATGLALWRLPGSGFHRQAGRQLSGKEDRPVSSPSSPASSLRDIICIMGSWNYAFDFWQNNKTFKAFNLQI